MKLFDFGAMILIAVLLFGGVIIVKKYHPEKYAAGVKVIKDVNTTYLDPYRTPGDGADEPEFKPEN